MRTLIKWLLPLGVVLLASCSMQAPEPQEMVPHSTPVSNQTYSEEAGSEEDPYENGGCWNGGGSDQDGGT